MAIIYDRVSVSPGVNVASRINQELQKIQEALERALDRMGSAPNAMESDLDMGLNSIINLQTLDVKELLINGEEPDFGSGGNGSGEEVDLTEIEQRLDFIQNQIDALENSGGGGNDPGTGEESVSYSMTFRVGKYGNTYGVRGEEAGAIGEFLSSEIPEVHSVTYVSLGATYPVEVWFEEGHGYDIEENPFLLTIPGTDIHNKVPEAVYEDSLVYNTFEPDLFIENAQMMAVVHHGNYELPIQAVDIVVTGHPYIENVQHALDDIFARLVLLED